MSSAMKPSASKASATSGEKRKVSAQQLVSLHLADYMSRIEALLKGLSKVSDKEVEDVMDSLIRKDQLLQNAVAKLIRHQQFQQKIASVKAEIAGLDDRIITFASKLGDLEQELHDAVTDEKTLKNLDGKITKQPFTVHDVTVLAEKLGQRSFAPAFFLEKKGMSIHNRPPQPIEAEMANSLLRLSIDELIKVSEINKQYDSSLAELGDVVDPLLAAGQAGGLQLEAPNKASSTALPSFDEMNHEAPEDWKPNDDQVIARRPDRPKMALDLNPDAESEEDDFSDDNESDDDF